jgi:hypothetical protein
LGEAGDLENLYVAKQQSSEGAKKKDFLTSFPGCLAASRPRGFLWVRPGIWKTFMSQSSKAAKTQRRKIS